MSIRHQRPFRAATASDDATIVFHQGEHLCACRAPRLISQPGAPYKYEKVRVLHTGPISFAHIERGVEHQDAHQVHSGRALRAVWRPVRQRRFRLQDLRL